MFERDVRSPEQALAYITDCTLATVADMAMRKSRRKGEFERQISIAQKAIADMAMRKSRRKGEFERQISIAQKAIDWMDQMGVSMENTRAEKVMAQGGSVDHWAKQFIDDSPRGK